MMLRSVITASMVLAATAALAQSTAPAPVAPPFVNQRHALAGRRGLAGNKTAGVQTPATLSQRVQDMESTLAQMHAVLKQMQTKAAKSSAKDSLAKANLEMWELLVRHLDKQLQELKLAAAAREDMEARRAALYKQADAKAEAEARAARAAQGAGSSSAGQAATPTPLARGAGAEPSPASQPAATQSSPAPPSTGSPSPN